MLETASAADARDINGGLVKRWRNATVLFAGKGNMRAIASK